MADTYRVNGFKRLLNRVMLWLARRGRGPAAALTTTGRHSGQARTVPVSPIEVDGVEYLVAPYGSVAWVVNARADPAAVLRKGSAERDVVLTEVTDDVAPVVAAYHQREKFPRRYMDVPGEPQLDDFRANATSFPVFRVGPRSFPT